MVLLNPQTSLFLVVMAYGVVGGGTGNLGTFIPTYGTRVAGPAVHLPLVTVVALLASTHCVPDDGTFVLHLQIGFRVARCAGLTRVQEVWVTVVGSA